MNKKVLLGSGSPRRRELLSMMDIEFDTIRLNDVNEVFPASLHAEEVAAYLSRLKAQSYIDKIDSETILITADTVVIVDDKIMGKPKNASEAKFMLQRLSGGKHKVITGVSLTTVGAIHTFDEVTIVEFDKISDADIDYYVEKYHPFDKAGSYGIQEWIGLIGVKKIDGCFYNVMGLPTSALYRHLKSIEIV